METNWVDLRGTDRRLYGRLNRETLELQIVRGDQEVLFDLVATVEARRAVVTTVERHRGAECGPKEK